MGLYFIGPDRTDPELHVTEIEKKLQQSCDEVRPLLARDRLAKTDRQKEEPESLVEPDQLKVREIG